MTTPAPLDPAALKLAISRAHGARGALASRHDAAVAELQDAARQAVLGSNPDELAGFVASLPEDKSRYVLSLALWRDAFAKVATELDARSVAEDQRREIIKARHEAERDEFMAHGTQVSRGASE